MPSGAQRAKKAKGRAAAKQSAFNGTDEEIITEAERRVEAGELERAADAYEYVARRQPNNSSVLDAFGEVLFELGRFEDAQKVLKHSVSINPKSGHSKHMMLAQMSEGADAVAHYSTGIEVLQSTIALSQANDGSSAEKAAMPAAMLQQLKRELSNGFCAIAELYMTDLCDEDKAEEDCAGYAQKALEADSSNPDAYIVAANLRLCQQRVHDAQQLLTRCNQVLTELYTALDQSVQAEEKGEEEEMEGSAAGTGSKAKTSGDLPPLPMHASRLQFAKTCSEAQLYAEAIHTLSRLLQEDDSDMEVWFLLGEALVLHERAGDAVEVLEEAEAMLVAAEALSGGAEPHTDEAADAYAEHAEAVTQLAEKDDDERKAMLTQMRALLAVAKSKAPQSTAGGADESDEESEDDEETMS